MWAAQGQEFGGIPLIIHIGDFTRLRSSLVMGVGDSTERANKLHAKRFMRVTPNAELARRMFMRYKETFILDNAQRFHDNDLSELLHCMRHANQVTQRNTHTAKPNQAEHGAP
jgi:hypothetical protein